MIRALRRIEQEKRLGSFTLVELLTVMAIIAILVALVLAASGGMMNKAARNRASTEIQGMSAALESYKADNGIYPLAPGLLTNSMYSYSSLDGTSTAYLTNSETLYQTLSGQTNYNDPPLSAGKSYMAFKVSQLGNATVASGTSGAGATTYVKDPWNYSYGYSTGTAASAPFNGAGFFDLWSTGGRLAAKANTNAWVANWQQ
jgi:prepilin-type N-terminal cleavage/methylation domain-containing protein